MEEATKGRRCAETNYISGSERKVPAVKGEGRVDWKRTKTVSRELWVNGTEGGRWAEVKRGTGYLEKERKGHSVENGVEN